MADPVRIYSPNPDAPQYVNVLTAQEPPRPWMERAYDAVAGIPNLLWRSLPPNVRDTYASGFNALVDMSTPASVRDYTNSAQDTARSAMQGDGWGTATNALATVNAALGAVPVAGLGVAAARKVANEVGEAAGKGAAKTIRAYHGSPHNFDRFDLSKIGTGEGAQAYGHGLYFAENEAVAKGYRDSLAAKSAPKSAGNVDLQDLYQLLPNEPETLLQARRDFRSLVEQGAIDPNDRRTFLDLVNKNIQAAKGGRMYEVQINADPAKFLDWDKPLTQQPPEVQELAKQLMANPGRAAGYVADADKFPLSGGNIYNGLAAKYGAEQASKMLSDAGVPGVRYLDAGSRAGAEGTRNYVAFDPAMIEILRKYGLLPFAGAAAGAAALPNGQPQEAR